MATKNGLLLGKSDQAGGPEHIFNLFGLMFVYSNNVNMTKQLYYSEVH